MVCALSIENIALLSNLSAICLFPPLNHMKIELSAICPFPPYIGSQESNMFLWTMLTDEKFIGAFGVVVLGLLGSL